MTEQNQVINCPNVGCDRPVDDHTKEELRTCLTGIAVRLLTQVSMSRPRAIPEGTASKVKIQAPQTDTEMFSAPDHLGVESLTKPFHYRGMIFGVGDHVDSVNRTMERREKELAEAR
jgi:hypothetical protein